MAAYLFLINFRDIVQGRTVAIFNVNISWLLAYPSLSSPSQCLDTALKLLALTALSLATRLVPLFVPTHINLADPISRQLVQVLSHQDKLERLVHAQLQTPPGLRGAPLLAATVQH